MSENTSSIPSTVYALNTFTLKDPRDVDTVVELIKKGVLTTSSKNPGYLSDKVFKSADNKVIVNMSEWSGGISQIASNHQGNEANPSYTAQMEEVGQYASFAAMAYSLVFEHSGEQSETLDKQAIVALMRDLGQAIIQRDRVQAEHILASDFRAVGWNARDVDREGYIKVHFASEHNFIQFEPANTQVQIYGSIALLFGVNMVHDANLGADVDQQKFTAVASRRNGSWQLIAYQETQVPNATQTA